MKSIKIKGLLAAILLLPFAANAAPINGNIGIGGSALPSCGGVTAGCDMAVADGLDYFGDSGFVLFALGDFTTTVSGGMTVAMQDFVFNPFAGVNPLWSVGGFSFDLQTLSIQVQDSNNLEMRGTGIVSGNGFDPTFGRWSFSGDSTTGVVFGWSSTTLAPEPGILLLMGLGLIGGLGARRLSRS